MVARRLEKKLPIDFTGGVIICCYAGTFARYVLCIFKEGWVEDYLPRLCSTYTDEELPDEVVDWLKQNDYDNLTIYGDVHHIVSCNDYEHLIGAEPGRKLISDMNCVK